MTSLTTEQVMELQQGKDILAIHAYIWPLVISVSVVLLLSRRLRWSKAANVDGGEPEANLQTRIPVGYDIVQQFTRAALFSLAVLGYVKDDSSTLQELVALGYALLLDAVRIYLSLNIADPCAIRAEPMAILENWRFLLLIISCLHHSSRLDTSSNVVRSGPSQKPMPSPEQTCSYFSYFVSYGWLTNVIFTGAKRRLVSSDMLPLPEYDEPLIWRERMLDARRLYNTTLKSLGYALRYNIGAMIFWATVTAVVEFLAPFGLYFLLNYIQNPSEATVRPWPWVLLLFLGPWGRSIAYQQYIFSSTRLVVRTRLCLVQEIYAKAARCFDSDSVQPDGEEESKAGETTRRGVKSRDNSGNSQAQSITNLMAYDVDSISNSRDFILVCTASPIEVTLGLVFLYRLFGPCSLITLLVMVLSFPLATILSRIMSGFQRRVMKKTDQRVSLISEYLSSIRTIKYLGWEDVLGKKVNEARREEESLTWRRNLTAVAVAVLGDFVPLFAMFALFTVYTLVLGNPLTASKAFTALSIIETLRLQFVWMANVTRFYTQARVAFARIDKFLIGEQEVARHPIGPPAFHNATFRRALPQDSFRLRLDGSFASGGLNIITGASGCGKSSLLLSLLGETVLEDGSATCPRDVAYSSQIPWLIDDTIRANILLHEEFNSDRYKRVIEACCLLHDLDMLENGDLTRVGANGSTLSGGQKQRISLARAIYSRSELLLLDDIFSALDAVTQKHVWEYCFQKDLLQGRTVILVTQMQAAKDAADLVMELSQGEIVSTTRRDTPNGRVKSPALLPQIPRMRKRTAEAVVKSIESTCPLRSDSIEAKVDQEIAGQGRNSRLLFFQYMVMFGGPGKAMLAITLCLFSQLAFFAIPLWLSVLVGASSGKDATNVGFYVAIYGAWLLAFSVIFAMSHAYLQWGARQAAHALHKKLVMAAMWVSVHCYEKNPPGRFINRFSSDMYSLDSILVEYLRVAIDNIFRFVLRLTAIGSIMPIFALPAAFICFIGFVCAELYTRTQLSVKALVSASQSPVFSFFVEGVAGRAVIRSRNGLQDAFADTLAKRMRVYARAAETQFNLNRWICVRADGCAAVIALATGIIAVSLESHAPAGRLGFSLTSAISLGQTILTMVRSMNELEAELNCFYRVREYASLPLEESDDPKDPPASIDLPASWPSNGKIEFRGVTAKYTRDGPAILCGLSLTISPGERVAIVGRTGSGKSTLALSLLGFTEIVEGTILVDDIDISTIPRRVLRRRLTIIPQEPVLFSSDVRSNIDPTLSVGDACLNKAIKACSIVKSLAAPRNGQLSQTATQESPLSTDDEREPRFTGLSLDAKVAPRGSNFSVGERQVLSLARATVRRSRVVVLDEATASLDHGSDAAFQQVLRSAFQGRTLLAIVHRLSTILDYDRVVVMGAGSILETGPPIELYKTGGTFASMVNQSIEHGKRGEWTQEKLKLLE